MTATTKALERLAEVARNKTKALQKSVQDYAVAVEDAKRVIEATTADTLSTGIAYETSGFKHAFDHLDLGPAQAKDYLHDLCKERGRPFLHAVDTHPQERWHTHKEFILLTIPKTPRLNSLAAGLNLVAQQGAVWEKPVTTMHSERLWRFTFYGPEGEEIFNDFRKQCAVNPVKRVILKLNSNLPTR